MRLPFPCIQSARPPCPRGARPGRGCSIPIPKAATRKPGVDPSLPPPTCSSPESPLLPFSPRRTAPATRISPSPPSTPLHVLRPDPVPEPPCAASPSRVPLPPTPSSSRLPAHGPCTSHCPTCPSSPPSAPKRPSSCPWRPPRPPPHTTPPSGRTPRPRLLPPHVTHLWRFHRRAGHGLAPSRGKCPPPEPPANGRRGRARGGRRKRSSD